MSKVKEYEAKVKDDYPFDTVTAFSGLEFVRYEWRQVPVKVIDEALVHPFLEIREVDGKELSAEAKDKLAESMKESLPEDAATTGEAQDTNEVQPDDTDEVHKRKVRRK